MKKTIIIAMIQLAYDIVVTEGYAKENNLSHRKITGRVSDNIEGLKEIPESYKSLAEVTKIDGRYFYRDTEIADYKIVDKIISPKGLVRLEAMQLVDLSCLEKAPFKFDLVAFKVI